MRETRQSLLCDKILGTRPVGAGTEETQKRQLFRKKHPQETTPVDQALHRCEVTAQADPIPAQVPPPRRPACRWPRTFVCRSLPSSTAHDLIKHPPPSSPLLPSPSLWRHCLPIRYHIPACESKRGHLGCLFIPVQTKNVPCPAYLSISPGEARLSSESPASFHRIPPTFFSNGLYQVPLERRSSRPSPDCLVGPVESAKGDPSFSHSRACFEFWP